MDAVHELPVVLRLVLVPERCGDQHVVSDRPLLEATDPHTVPGPLRPCVRADQVQWYSTPLSFTMRLRVLETVVSVDGPQHVTSSEGDLSDEDH